MFIAQRFEEMVDAISPVVGRWQDVVVPGEVELLPNNRYSPRYAWMFSYEKRLKYRIEELLRRPLKELEHHLFGSDGAFSEGLSNAFVHGHRRDPAKALEICCATGRRGLAFSIRDQGPGFDVAHQLELARRGAARYHFAGNGMRVLAESTEIQAAYEEEGRQLDLMVRF